MKSDYMSNNSTTPTNDASPSKALTSSASLKNWLALDKNFINYFSITTFGLILLFFYRGIEEIKKGRELAYKARKLQAEDTGNPFEIGKLSEALKFYQEANKLINDSKLISLEKNLEQELEKRKKFLDFFLTRKNPSRGVAHDFFQTRNQQETILKLNYLDFFQTRKNPEIV